jgi:hypothetical protein
MNGYSLFKFDKATKLHFTNEKYNVFEYKGSVRGLTFEKFLEKRDYNVYNAVARKFESEKEAIQFLVANYAYRNDNPIHNIAMAERNISIWNKRKQSISHLFKEDIDVISLHLEKKGLVKSDLFETNGDVPELFKLFIGGKISVETMHILNEMNDYITEWEPIHSVVWKKEFLVIKKLKKFVKFDIDKLKEIYNDF